MAGNIIQQLAAVSGCYLPQPAARPPQVWRSLSSERRAWHAMHTITCHSMTLRARNNRPIGAIAGNRTHRRACDFRRFEIAPFGAWFSSRMWISLHAKKA